MNEPTEAEVKELWEWCGLTKAGVWWFSPRGKMMDVIPPRIDLNNLFKYAVPKLKELNRYNIELKSLVNYPSVYLARIEANLNPNAYPNSKTNDKDPALALFWAIYKVMKEAV